MGQTFSLDDSVVVLYGPHRGKRGLVVGLVRQITVALPGTRTTFPAAALKAA